MLGKIKKAICGIFLPQKLLNKISETNSIGICAPYFDEDKLKDGYYRRIKAVDDLLKSRYRVYFSKVGSIIFPKIVFPNENTAVFEYNANLGFHNIIRNFLVRRIGVVYCHSVYQVEYAYFKISKLKIYLDVHGAVPEEEMLKGNEDYAKEFGEKEYLCVKEAEHIFCVTSAMEKHLKEKYPNEFKGNCTILPIYDDRLFAFPDYRQFKNSDTVTVVYAGGCAKWQKIELMQETIYKTRDKFVFKICVPDVCEFYDTWKYGEMPASVTVESKTYDELCRDVYSLAQYGFVLRDDITVNNVACPTKIAEYIKYNIVPVVNTPNIGDFKQMGMKYITLEDFVDGKLMSEDEFNSAVLNNQKLLENYKSICENGAHLFKQILC